MLSDIVGSAWSCGCTGRQLVASQAWHVGYAGQCAHCSHNPGFSVSGRSLSKSVRKTGDVYLEKRPPRCRSLSYVVIPNVRHELAFSTCYSEACLWNQGTLIHPISKMTDPISNFIWEKCVPSANYTNTTHVMMYQKWHISPRKRSFWYFITLYTLEFKQWDNYPKVNMIINETIQWKKTNVIWNHEQVQWVRAGTLRPSPQDPQSNQV